jgi:hypothetical protein
LLRTASIPFDHIELSVVDPCPRAEVPGVVDDVGHNLLLLGRVRIHE